MRHFFGMVFANARYVPVHLARILLLARTIPIKCNKTNYLPKVFRINTDMYTMNNVDSTFFYRQLLRKAQTGEIDLETLLEIFASLDISVKIPLRVERLSHEAMKSAKVVIFIQGED